MTYNNGPRSFAVSAPCVWNDLPPTQCASLEHTNTWIIQKQHAFNDNSRRSIIMLMYANYDSV